MSLRAATSAVVLLSMAACSTVRPVAKPIEFIPSHNPQRIWVTNTENETYILTHPRVDGDNLVGSLLNSGEEMSIPVSKAQLVEARQHDKKKTTITALTLSAVGVGMVVLALSASAAAQEHDTCPEGGC